MNDTVTRFESLGNLDPIFTCGIFWLISMFFFFYVLFIDIGSIIFPFPCFICPFFSGCFLFVCFPFFILEIIVADDTYNIGLCFFFFFFLAIGGSAGPADWLSLCPITAGAGRRRRASPAPKSCTSMIFFIFLTGDQPCRCICRIYGRQAVKILAEKGTM